MRERERETEREKERERERERVRKRKRRERGRRVTWLNGTKPVSLPRNPTNTPKGATLVTYPGKQA